MLQHLSVRLQKVLSFICYLLECFRSAFYQLFLSCSDKKSQNHFMVWKSIYFKLNILSIFACGISYLVKSWQLLSVYDVMTFDMCQGVNNILKMTYWPPIHYTQHTQLCNFGIYSWFTAELWWWLMCVWIFYWWIWITDFHCLQFVTNV